MGAWTQVNGFDAESSRLNSQIPLLFNSFIQKPFRKNKDYPLCDQPAPERPSALLWDESYLWGVTARQALIEAGLPFELIRSDEIRTGALSRYRMLFVTGGWASAKLRSLREKGRAEIRCFVENGGGYLGICGGAGLATQSGIGLLPIQRKAMQERVPSFSGPVRLLCIISLTNEQAMLSKTKMNGCCAVLPAARQWKQYHFAFKG